MKGVKGMKGMKKIFMAVILLAFVDLGFLFAEQDLGTSAESSAKRNPRSFPAVKARRSLANSSMRARSSLSAARLSRPRGFRPASQTRLRTSDSGRGKTANSSCAASRRDCELFRFQGWIRLRTVPIGSPGRGRRADRQRDSDRPAGRVGERPGHRRVREPGRRRAREFHSWQSVANHRIIPIGSGGGAITTEDGRYLVGGLSAGEYAISVRSFMESVETTSSGNDIVIIPNRRRSPARKPRPSG